MSFPACHGIGIDPPEIGLELGWLAERPPASIRVDVVGGVERAADSELVWQLVEPPDFGLPEITTETWREPDGSTWVGNTLNLSLRVDYARNAVAIAPKDENRQILLEGLASIALPLVLQDRGGIVLHGAAVAHDGRGVLLCAEGGSGKSSLLMALVAAGWDAISEDQCAVDWDERGAHRVWPGPSWVRLKQGVAPTRLVNGTAPRFEALDKVAWDLGAWMAHEPVRLEKLVILDPPGGADVVWEPLAPAEAVPEMAKYVTWLRGGGFLESSLPQVARLTQEVPAFRMRLPVRADWLDYGVPLLAET